MTTSSFVLTETQAMLRDSLDRYLAEQYDIEIRNRALVGADTQPPLWRALARDLGLLGASFDERMGGLGGSIMDAFIVIETLGGHLAAEPYLSSVIVAGGLLRRCNHPAALELLGAVLEGVAVVALAHEEPRSSAHSGNRSTEVRRQGTGWLAEGRKSMVYCGPWATDLLVTASDEDGTPMVFHLPANAAGVSRRDYQTLDGGRASELFFDNVPVFEKSVWLTGADAALAFEAVWQEGALAVSAEACGLLDRVLADTIEYARQRKQFGAPIASFQAIRHRVADMFMAVRQCKAMTAMAADAWVRQNSNPDDRANLVSAAKIAAANACRVVGQGAVQIHGGMGMTDELAVSHFFRRAVQIEQLFGSSDHHLRALARAWPS
jgi:alkylation response protein AidB-like acyl-CoA dehydrogenase